MRKIYLAGPDVFRKNAVEHGKHLKELCTKYGFKGLFPLDNEIDTSNNFASLDIFIANMNMISDCDFILANLDPFRGPSVDPGTAWEIGAAFGLGKTCFGYYTEDEYYQKEYIEKVKEAEEPYSNIEGFGLSDNLMIIQSLSECFIGFEGALKKLKYLEEKEYYYFD